ncbi:hypothetical protein ZWY2020_052359 [Hordeum vulgare]|nr:hypothetical protein ZWY2020_052359 [Hordeum vulgare]
MLRRASSRLLPEIPRRTAPHRRAHTASAALQWLDDELTTLARPPPVPGPGVDAHACARLLQGCVARGDAQGGRAVHSHVLRGGGLDLFCANVLLNLYGSTPSSAPSPARAGCSTACRSGTRCPLSRSSRPTRCAGSTSPPRRCSGGCGWRATR